MKRWFLRYGYSAVSGVAVVCNLLSAQWWNFLIAGFLSGLWLSDTIHFHFLEKLKKDLTKLRGMSDDEKLP